MKVWNWLKDHWYLPLIFLGAVLGFLLSRKSRKRGTPIKQTVAELDAIQAKSEVRQLEVELGAEQAKKHVEDKYQSERAALDAKQEAQAKELEEDPAALAKFLVKAGKK